MKRAAIVRPCTLASEAERSVWRRIAGTLALLAVVPGLHPVSVSGQDRDGRQGGRCVVAGQRGGAGMGPTFDAKPGDQTADIDPLVLQEIIAIRRQLGSVVEGLGYGDDDEQFRHVLQNVIRDTRQQSVPRTSFGFDAPRTDTVGPAFVPGPVAGRSNQSGDRPQGLPGARNPAATPESGQMKNRKWHAARSVAEASGVVRRSPDAVVVQPPSAGQGRSPRLHRVAVNLEHLAAELEELGRFADADQVRKIAGGVRADSRRNGQDTGKQRR